MRKAPASRRGQSLIEVIVASGIIMTAVSGCLTLVGAALRAEKNSESSIVAGNLAREGVEVVRTIRDSNWLAGVAFDTGLVGASNDYTGTVVFDPTANTWTMDFVPNLITDVRARLYRNNAASGTAALGLMRQAAAQPASTVISSYNRLIEVAPLCDNGAGGYTIITSGSCGAATKVGIRVTSTVSWNIGGTSRSMAIEERMLDWR